MSIMEALLSWLIASSPSIAIIIAIIILWYEIRLLKYEIRFLRNDIAHGFKVLETFNYALIDILESKGILAGGEAIALKEILKSLPTISSKYYTAEVARRLKELIEKKPEELTMEEVRELRKIADLIIEEYKVTDREDLLDYGVKLKVYCALVEGRIWRKIAEEALKREAEAKQS